MTTQTAIYSAIQVLTAHQNLRVWSFIVTLFGDLARGKHDELSGTVLGQLTERVGIKPASMRVALHRLRKDGWIDTRRDGRAGWYFLTDNGRAETLAFSQRVYASAQTTDNPKDETWHLAVFPPNTASSKATAPLLPLPGYSGLFFGIGAHKAFPDALTIKGQIGPTPNWLRDALSGPDLRGDYCVFEEQLKKVSTLVPSDANAFDRAVLRGLIVHSWRKLLLRHPDLPDGFLGPECRIEPCRASVTILLNRLGTITPEDLTRVEIST